MDTHYSLKQLHSRSFWLTYPLYFCKTTAFVPNNVLKMERGIQKQRKYWRYQMQQFYFYLAPTAQEHYFCFLREKNIWRFFMLGHKSLHTLISRYFIFILFYISTKLLAQQLQKLYFYFLRVERIRKIPKSSQIKTFSSCPIGKRKKLC